MSKTMSVCLVIAAEAYFLAIEEHQKLKNEVIAKFLF